MDAWVPKFISDSDSNSSEGGFYESDEESKFEDKDLDNVKEDSDVEKVSETSGMQENEIGNDNEHSIHREENLHSSDPFNIYELLQKKKDNIHQTKESDPTHPLGFTPELGNNNKEEGSNSVNDQRKSASGKKIFSYHNVEASTHHTTCMPITGGPILDVMDNLVKVGQTMGVFSTWMAFGGNTHDLGSFGEETNKITDLHQIHEEVLFTEHGDGVTGIMRRRRDLSSDGVRDLATASGRGRLKEDLESST
ncbi:hypothetical protein Tco_0873866 [Tanacetum coccineum]|uniref:Uncharacterized protein n=1 Tax=Tanacetum coccineum TaxID=301880 RepID=A0ABQ5BK04_9ASTR